MKDWHTLQPDRVKLMNKHFTPGRGGKNIDCVVVHHNAGILSVDQIWQVWQDRAASAHYQVTSFGEIGQLVWDRDTAWHAANQSMNQRSIGIEVSNSGGQSQDWPITDLAIREAGRLIAAVCAYYKLGRPQSGKNVRYHREFTGTSCPYHLAPGGKYHAALMGEAQRFYDQLTNTAPAPTPPAQKGPLMALTDQEQQELLDKTRDIHHEMVHRFQSRYRDTNGTQSDFRDTIVGFVLEIDRKVEDIHANMLPTIWDRIKNVFSKEK